MKKVFLCMVVMLAFQFCTTELNEIDAVLSKNTEIKTEADPIPLGSFLAQYFNKDNYSSVLATRVEKSISHDFNTVVSPNVSSDNLGATWTGKFNFDPKVYEFTVKSDRSVRILIDNEELLGDFDNSTLNEYKIKKYLKGIHRIKLYYNFDISEINLFEGSEYNDADHIDTGSENGQDASEEAAQESGEESIADNSGSGTDPVNEGENTGETDQNPAGQDAEESNSSGSDAPISDPDSGITEPDTGTSDPSDGTDNSSENTEQTDPVVEIDNGDPTVEIDWQPVDDNILRFFDGFEDGIKNPPWKIVGDGTIEKSSKYKVSGKYSMRMYIAAEKGYNNARCQAQFQGNEEGSISKYLPHFTTWGVKFAMYIPEDFQPDRFPDLFFQLKGYADAHDSYNGNPIFSMKIQENKIRATVNTLSEDPATEDDKVRKDFYNIASVTPGKWHYFVIDSHFDYRDNGKGYHKVYMKKGSPPSINDIIVDYEGPTSYHDELNAYPVLNVYRSDWNKDKNIELSRQDGVTHREIYMDDFELQQDNYLYIK
ncbi:MAG: heparin lyase I family protein [Cytophagales bacterium]|nr:heparin lyase I family protein [Cytophagales bacterium]